MTKDATPDDTTPPDRSFAVALITIARYLARKESDFGPFLSVALEHAEAAKLAEADLAMLRMLVGATTAGPDMK